MFRESEKEWILEAINHLKRRKARPDLTRISLRMKRKYLIAFPQTKKLLDSLIESGIVVKAVYKNDTSYRDVSKWKKGRLCGRIMNSNRMLKRFIKAIRETEVQKDTGVSAQSIEEYLCRKISEKHKCFLSGPALKDALEKEIENGFLFKRERGNSLVYIVNEEHVLISLPGLDLDNLDLDDEQEDMSDQEGEETDENGKNFTLFSSEYLFSAISDHQTKGFKGASFSDIKKSLYDKGIAHADTNINFCLSDSVKKGVIVSHTTTVNNGNLLYLYSLKPLQSEIMDPKIEAVSFDNSNQYSNLDPEEIHKKLDVVTSSLEKMLQNNSSCPKKNAKPSSSAPLRAPSKRKRVMKYGDDYEIEMPGRSKSRLIENKDSVYPTPTGSPAPEQSEMVLDNSSKAARQIKKRGRPKKDETTKSTETIYLESIKDDNSRQGSISGHSSVCIDDESSMQSLPTVPDLSSWTPQQVADYFKNKGYVDEAEKIIENELDGVSLGLLKRSDIVGPPLGGTLGVKKLGRALKLFRDIRDLLYHGNADNYVDPYEERPFARFV